MAFQIQNFARVSTSADEAIVNIQDPVKVDSNQNPLLRDVAGCFREYSYFSKTWVGGVSGGAAATATGDSHYVISQPGYFDQVKGDLQQHDLIRVYSYVDRAYALYRVEPISIQSPYVTVRMVGSVQAYWNLSAATLLGLTVPGITLINGGANCVIVVNKVKFCIPAGASKAANGSQIYLRYTNSTTGLITGELPYSSALGQPVTNAEGFLPSTFLTTGTANVLILPGDVLLDTHTNANNSVNLTLAANGAAFTAVNGPLSVYLDYEILPLL